MLLKQNFFNSSGVMLICRFCPPGITKIKRDIVFAASLYL